MRGLVRIAEGRAETRPALALPVVRREPARPEPRRRSTGLWLALAATVGVVVYALFLFGPNAPTLAEGDAPKTEVAAFDAAPLP